MGVFVISNTFALLNSSLPIILVSVNWMTSCLSTNIGQLERIRLSNVTYWVLEGGTLNVERVEKECVRKKRMAERHGRLLLSLSC